MLKIRDISKQYKTGDLVQNALDHVSLSLRDNEFVAILGPSGSGKTTLLNIIGGLDRYDSGDLIINGTSTKRYSDRDWDSYRNHTIGFVFQSYNLIPHQTVLANVELALTISGISRKERRKKARLALEKVGLGNQLHKKPNQMSGGQMQRVAIARALVNDPEILLADEPTGALDTNTSIQVMDLLQEVAKERLVVMVTHNPELAEQYATRIVNLRDGKITGDSMPLHDDDDEEAVHRNMGHSSMSFLTSLSLSLNNLATKKGRTFLTAFAGSIGIIGIALIMSLSNGVDQYIKNVEEETLSEYPLSITGNSMDLSAFMSGGGGDDNIEGEGEVLERQVVNSLFSGYTSNDLASLKEYLDSEDETIRQYATALEYGYSLTPQIFRLDEKSGYRQVNPDKTLSSLSGGGNGYLAMGNVSAGVFNALPRDEGLYVSQYEVVAGKWPENYNECVLVISSRDTISDLALYTLGLKDASELDSMLEQVMKDEPVEVALSRTRYKYEDFVGLEFKVVDVADFYEYDAEYNVYVDKTENHDYMLSLVKNSEPLMIVGVAKPLESASANMLATGIGYHSSLIDHVMRNAAQSEIVRKQLADSSIDVFTGKDFSEQQSSFDMESLFTFDEEAFSKAFQFDQSALNLDTSAFDFSDMDIDFSSLDFSSMEMPQMEMPEMDLANLGLRVDGDQLLASMQDILHGYMAHAALDPSTDYANIGQAVGSYFESDEARGILDEGIARIRERVEAIAPSQEEISTLVQGILRGFATYMEGVEINEETDLSAYIEEYLASDEVNNALAEMGSEVSERYASLEGEPEVEVLLTNLYDGYEGYAQENDMPDPSLLMDSFTEYLSSPEGAGLVNDAVHRSANIDEVQASLMSGISSSMGSLMEGYGQMVALQMENVVNQIGNRISLGMRDMMSQLSTSMEEMFSFDPAALENVLQINMDGDQLNELMSSMMSTGFSSYETNLRKLNYAESDKPSSISIYPRDFESKSALLAMLDAYNERMEKAGDKEKVITYTDLVGTLMSNVTDIIDTISYVLIAFVAISLIVSSIMIGIITYISVLERTKEIGILRAIGASKRNVSQVFSAETFIIGLLAGVIGIVVAALLLIPGNMLIHAISGNEAVNAILPVSGAALLVVISVVLTLTGGIIPSRAAAKKDPVTALRSE